MTSTEKSNIIIRCPDEDDIANLAANLSPEVTTDRLNRRWKEHLKDLRNMLIAELDGEVVGTVSTTTLLYQLPNSLRLLALDLGPKFRRRGVGTALVEEVEQRARRKGLRSVNLEVGVDNGVGLRLYERRGYERVGNPRWVVGDLAWIMLKAV